MYELFQVINILYRISMLCLFYYELFVLEKNSRSCTEIRVLITKHEDRAQTEKTEVMLCYCDCVNIIN